MSLKLTLKQIVVFFSFYSPSAKFLNNTLIIIVTIKINDEIIIIAPPDGIDISKCIGKYTPNKQLTRAKITEYPTKPFIDFDKFFAAAAGIKSKASTSIDPIIFTEAIVIIVTIIIKVLFKNFAEGE